MKFKTFSKTTKALVACSFFLLPNLALASGGLMITPSYLEFNEGKEAQDVKLINRGNEASTYRISFQNFRITQDGAYEEINSQNLGEEKFAEKFITFSPKRVTLKPGETQTIRLLAKKPNEVGEYRSHLLMKEEAPADFGSSFEQKASKDKKKISVMLKPLFAISIPVIIRNGDISSTIAINSVAVKTDQKEKTKSLSVQMTRTGNASSRGTLVAILTPKGSTTKHEIGLINNVGIYFPYSKRDINVPITFPAKVKTAGATIEVRFQVRNSDGSEEDKGSKILAQKSITL